MNILFEDWFLINIIHHANMSTLSNLKFINKYYNKHITKRILKNQISKCIKNPPPYMTSIYDFTLDNSEFECQQGPIIIPKNTFWKYSISIDVVKTNKVMIHRFKFNGEIINAFNNPKIIINEPKHMHTPRHHYEINLKIQNNIITLIKNYNYEMLGTITIQSMQF